MAQTLYLECNSGISGDMVVGALLDLGASREKLESALASLSVDGFGVRISRVTKAGLDACDFAVLLDEAHENHDHDMAYLHGEGDNLPDHDHDHDHDHD
ncbi:nickel insertion protein, partial [Slackia sp.]|uniref:nickel insertion protein n=1 Tax=Slackia sp. TaxID=2049041 RepID=UPI00399AB3EF